VSLRSKIIATSHEAPYKRAKWGRFARMYFRLMEKIFLRSSVLLTSVSKPLSDYYYQKYGREVHYVPNGVDIESQCNYEAADELLDRFGIKGEYLFFAARRIIPTKGCHTFLEALRLSNYQGQVVIAGEDVHGSTYMDEIREASQGLAVKFIGFVRDKPTLMALISRAKFFIFPSEIEGLSIMLLEVASIGTTPMICSDIPENKQVFDDSQVLFFGNRDTGDLARKLDWACENEESMATRAIAAKKQVVSDFSTKRVALRYDELYRQLLSQTNIQ